MRPPAERSESNPKPPLRQLLKAERTEVNRLRDPASRSPLFSHVLFGLYLALFAWGGLWLRDPALRRLLPLRL